MSFCRKLINLNLLVIIYLKDLRVCFKFHFVQTVYFNPILTLIAKMAQSHVSFLIVALISISMVTNLLCDIFQLSSILFPFQDPLCAPIFNHNVGSKQTLGVLNTWYRLNEAFTIISANIKACIINQKARHSTIWIVT